MGEKEMFRFLVTLKYGMGNQSIEDAIDENIKILLKGENHEFSLKDKTDLFEATMQMLVHFLETKRARKNKKDLLYIAKSIKDIAIDYEKEIKEGD